LGRGRSSRDISVDPFDHHQGELDDEIDGLTALAGGADCDRW
jgi:hypothetical protein